jgi:hypothetical protein
MGCINRHKIRWSPANFDEALLEPGVEQHGLCGIRMEQVTTTYNAEGTTAHGCDQPAISPNNRAFGPPSRRFRGHSVAKP